MMKLGVKKNALEALHCATSIAARINRLEGKIGTLEAGRVADVIVTNGKPDQQIADVSSVQMVFVGGARRV